MQKTPQNTPVRPISEFDADNSDLFVSHIDFTNEVPYFVVQSESDLEGEGQLFAIPKALAYYARVHRRWTDEGDEDKREQGKHALRIQFRKLLGLEGH